MTAFHWPLERNRIRRGLNNHTFGMVRRNADGSKRAHQGWDLEAAPGTPCFAVADGRIAHVLNSGAYGKVIVLRFLLEGRTHFAAYCHLSRIDVAVGDSVGMGQPIGLTGNSGNAAGMTGEDCHLHFELRTEPLPGLGLGGRVSPIKLFGVCPLDKAYPL